MPTVSIPVTDIPRPFDLMIGKLDRLLSEFLLAAEGPLDGPDYQTVKHHADDLIGVGNAALKRLLSHFRQDVDAYRGLDPAHDPTGAGDRLPKPSFPPMQDPPTVSLDPNRRQGQGGTRIG